MDGTQEIVLDLSFLGGDYLLLPRGLIGKPPVEPDSYLHFIHVLDDLDTKHCCLMLRCLDGIRTTFKRVDIVI
jgi:hypothetical protein